MAAIKASPVTVDMVDANALKALRANADTGKTVLFSFWSTTCKICATQFLEIENTYRMYRRRPFDLVTISTDAPDKSAAVLDFLKQQYASGPNKQFASADVNALQAAWGAKWNPNLGLTVVERLNDPLEPERAHLDTVADGRHFSRKLRCAERRRLLVVLLAAGQAHRCPGGRRACCSAAHQGGMGQRLQEIEGDRKQRRGPCRRAPALVGASANHGAS